MTSNQKKALLKAQQGELDAVILYKKLAEQMKGQEKKKLLKEIAMDEGKHAAILRNYTGQNLKPSGGKAVFIIILYKILGEKNTFNLISKGELDSLKGYSQLVKDFPKIQSIMEDEVKHAGIVKSMQK